MLTHSAGFAIIYKGKILLSHATGASWHRSYSVIKGKQEPGESLFQTALREMKEETGIIFPTKLYKKVPTPDITVTTADGKKQTNIFVVYIDSLSDLGLKDEKIPKDQLQLDEIDWAGFIDAKEAEKRIAPYQLPVLEYIKKPNMSDKLPNLADEEIEVGKKYQHPDGEVTVLEIERNQKGYKGAPIGDIVTFEYDGKDGKKEKFRGSLKTFADSIKEHKANLQERKSPTMFQKVSVEAQLFVPVHQAQKLNRDFQDPDVQEIIQHINKIVAEMPKTYGTQGIKANDKIIWLHYQDKTNGSDWWIAEKDQGDPDDDSEFKGKQIEAYGAVDFEGGAEYNVGGVGEWGYINIEELRKMGPEVELGLNWVPKKWGEIVDEKTNFAQNSGELKLIPEVKILKVDRDGEKFHIVIEESGSRSGAFPTNAEVSGKISNGVLSFDELHEYDDYDKREYISEWFGRDLSDSEIIDFIENWGEAEKAESFEKFVAEKGVQNIEKDTEWQWPPYKVMGLEKDKHMNSYKYFNFYKAYQGLHTGSAADITEVFERYIEPKIISSLEDAGFKLKTYIDKPNWLRIEKDGVEIDLFENGTELKFLNVTKNKDKPDTIYDGKISLWKVPMYSEQEIMDAVVKEMNEQVEEGKLYVKQKPTITMVTNDKPAESSVDLTKIATDGENTIKYVPVSTACGYDLDTVLPKSMAQATYNALNHIKKQVANMGYTPEEYVLDRLHYTPKELGVEKQVKGKSPEETKKIMLQAFCESKMFAPEQIDATMEAIFNIEVLHEGMIIGDQTGIGKGRSQPLTAKLLTPTGWKLMGDIRVGDSVISVDGKPTNVMGIYPQGKIDVYEIVFSDGSKTECSADHLWTTINRQQKYTGKTTPESIYAQFKVWTTKELIGKVNQLHSIPLVSPVEFEAQEVPADPYLIGIELTNADDEILRSVQGIITKHDEKLTLKKTRKYHYQISKKKRTTHRGGGHANTLLDAIRLLGLAGKIAPTKFIPDVYKYNSVAVRIAILQGLMDTDGYVNAKGSSMYYTVSDQLADDVVFLVQSLGGIATRGVKKTYRLDCHIVYIKLPSSINPFRLLRKANRVAAWTKYFPQRIIRSITKIGKKECQCIRVDHASSLYVTDDFIVTHNTAAAVIRYAVKHLHKQPIFLTEKDYLFSDIFRDLIDIKGDVNIPFKYKTGDKTVPVKMSKKEIEKAIEDLVENSGLLKDEATTQVMDQVVRGFKLVPVYQQNKNYQDEIRAAKKAGKLVMAPFIMNDDKDSTRVKNLNGDLLYYAMNNSSAEFKHAMATGEIPKEYAFVMSTYSQFQKGTKTAKIKFFEDFVKDNVIILDESQNASGDSNRGRFLTEAIMQAYGTLFLSATYAKRPDNMTIYAAKTSMRDTGLDKEELTSAIIRGGVPMQEIISDQLASEGQYLRRERSYKGVNIFYRTMDESMAEIGHPELNLKVRHRAIADIFTDILRDLINFQMEDIQGPGGYCQDPAVIKATKEGYGIMDIPKGFNIKSMLTSSPIFSRLFNITNQLLFSIKAEAIAECAIDKMKQGKKPVIAFYNTMEAFLDTLTDDDDQPLSEGKYFSTDFKHVLEKLLNMSLMIKVKIPGGDERKEKVDENKLSARTQETLRNLRFRINNASTGICISPIDVIITKIQAAGFNVTEITGRDTMVKFEQGSDFMNGTYTKRTKRPTTDVFREFNQNKIDCLLINQSGSTGGSVQAKENDVVNHVRVRTKDGSGTESVLFYRGIEKDRELVIPSSLEPRDEIKQRSMLILQPELNIDTEVQKRGRVNRSGQVMKPEYEYLSTAIPAETRFQMMLQKKMRSLDANTSSNQRQSNKLIDIVDFLNPIGDTVVAKYLLEDRALVVQLGDPLKMINSQTGVFSIADAVIENAAHKVTGRIAILSCTRQEDFYNEVSKRYLALVEMLKQSGDYDLEVEYLDLQATNETKQLLHIGLSKKSLFGRNSILEACEVNNLRKPFTEEEIKLFLKNELTDFEQYPNPSKAYQQNLLKKHRSYVENRIRTFKEDITSDGEIRKTYLQTDKGYVTLLGKSPERAANMLTTRAEVIDKDTQDKIATQTERITNQSTAVRNKLEQLAPGMVFDYPIGEGESKSLVRAVILGVDIDEYANNPWAPSNMRLRIAISNGIKFLSIPFSDDERIAVIIMHKINSLTEAKNTIEHWSEVTKDAISDRVRRYLVTGNILLAMGDKDIQANGRLIKFTTDRNTIRNGILMHDFWIPALMEKGKGSVVSVPARFCVPLLERLTPGDKKTYTTDDLMQFTRIANGDFQVSIPRRADFKDMYTDLELLDFMLESAGMISKNVSIEYRDPKDKSKSTYLPALSGTVMESDISAFLEVVSQKYSSFFRIPNGVFETIKDELGINLALDYEDDEQMLDQSESGLSEIRIEVQDPVTQDVINATNDPVSAAANEVTVDVVEELPVMEAEPVSQIIEEQEKEKAQLLHDRRVLEADKKLFTLYQLLMGMNVKFKKGGGVGQNPEIIDAYAVEVVWLDENDEITDVEDKYIAKGFETNATKPFALHDAVFFYLGANTDEEAEEKIKQLFEGKSDEGFYISEAYYPVKLIIENGEVKEVGGQNVMKRGGAMPTKINTSVDKDLLYEKVNEDCSADDSYDNKQYIEFTMDDFKGFVWDKSDSDHWVKASHDKLLSKIFPENFELDSLRENGSGANDNKYFNEFKSINGALYDIWVEAMKKATGKEPNKFESGGGVGRIKSALMRDRKYTSEQEWEKAYHRAGRKAFYKKDGGAMQPRVYLLGDKYSDDFDYEGMLITGIGASETMGVDGLEKLYKSLVDVNYSSQARKISEAIDFLKKGDKIAARKALVEFNKLCGDELKPALASGAWDWDHLRPNNRVTFLKNNAKISDDSIIDKKFSELNGEYQKKISDAFAFIEKYRGDHYNQGGALARKKLLEDSLHLMLSDNLILNSGQWANTGKYGTAGVTPVAVNNTSGQYWTQSNVNKLAAELNESGVTLEDISDYIRTSKDPLSAMHLYQQIIGKDIVQASTGDFYFDTRKNKTFRITSVDGADMGIQYYGDDKKPVNETVQIKTSEFDFYTRNGAWNKWQQPYFKQGGGMYRQPNNPVEILATKLQMTKDLGGNYMALATEAEKKTYGLYDKADFDKFIQDNSVPTDAIYGYKKGGTAGKITISYYRWGEFQEEIEAEQKELDGMQKLTEEQMLGAFEVRPEDVGKTFYAEERYIDEDEDTGATAVKISFAVQA